MSILDIKHHQSDVLVIIVKLLRLVAELGSHFDDAVEGLVGDHGLEPDVELQEGGGVGLVQRHVMQPCPRAWLTDVLKHAPVEFESLESEPP